MQTLASNLSLAELARLADQQDNELARRIISLVTDGDGLASLPLTTALSEAYTNVENFLENLENYVRDELLDSDHIESRIQDVLSDFNIDNETECQTAIEKMIEKERDSIIKSLKDIWIDNLLDSNEQRILKSELESSFDNVNSADLPDSFEFDAPF